ncbi:MAG: methyltransferase type 11 [Gammaproteobacteria bacterium]|nr:MAG: methyltransferase type 11 [Gammaproteobacteria bacterium]
MHELPKRQQVLTVCGTEQDLAVAMAYLVDRGRTVAEQIIWTEQLKQQLDSAGQLETGSQSVQLWKPASLWQYFVEKIAPANDIQPGRGLDIACGAGRDMVYLAQHGWEMTGVDRSQDSLQRVAVLAKYSGVEVDTLQCDLETGSDPFTAFEDGSFSLICVARYLHRPLFSYLKRLLKPGGVVMYQTFMEGCEKTAIGRPRNPAFLLKQGELAGIFADYTVLLDEVAILEDGRSVAEFIARS